jgi:hypothetical protein
MANNSDYRVADGHGVAYGSLNVIDPQPTANGVEPTRRTFAASGAVYDEGEFIELEWSAVSTDVEYRAILAFFGLNGLPLTMTNDVTVNVRNPLFVFARYNGTAVHPEMGRDVKWRNYFPRDVVILVKNLVAL